MKKIGLFLVACVVLFIPLFKLLDSSITVYQTISGELKTLQASIAQISLDDQTNHQQLVDDNLEIVHGVRQSIEILITMYNRIVSILILSLLLVIGLAIWKSTGKPNKITKASDYKSIGS